MLRLFFILLVTALAYSLRGVSRLVQPLRYSPLQCRTVYISHVGTDLEFPLCKRFLSFFFFLVERMIAWKHRITFVRVLLNPRSHESISAQSRACMFKQLLTCLIKDQDWFNHETCELLGFKISDNGSMSFSCIRIPNSRIATIFDPCFVAQKFRTLPLLAKPNNICWRGIMITMILKKRRKI
jgi:hypothetical protein